MTGTYARPPIGNATARAAMESRHDKSTAKVRKVERDRREAYRLVDIRDGRKCRACGASKNLEHHHLIGRGRRESESTAAICLLCKSCHDLKHVKRTLRITGNANQVLTFELLGKVWNG